MNNIVFIYTLADPRTGIVRYVGKAVNVKKRFQAHLECRKTTKCSSWVKSLQYIGLKPIIEVLEEVDSPNEEWQESERFWIETLRFIGCPLTNLDSGGNGRKRLSAETRLKISASHRGIKPNESTRLLMSRNRTGRKLSLAHRQKISKAGMGRQNTLRHRLLLSKRCKGVPLSEAHKAKLKEAWKSRKIIGVSDETRRKLSIVGLRTGRNADSQRRKSESIKRFYNNKKSELQPLLNGISA